jgi:hypothetical protein
MNISLLGSKMQTAIIFEHETHFFVFSGFCKASFEECIESYFNVIISGISVLAFHKH